MRSMSVICRKSLLALLMAIMILSASGCGREPEKQLENQRELNQNAITLNEVTTEGEAAYETLKAIEEAWPIREAGEPSEIKAAEGLAALFEAKGIMATLQSFEYALGSSSDKRYSQNVVASIHVEQKRRVVIGAHYDCVNTGKGADDNGSGVVAVLALAEALKEKRYPFGIDFVLFGAEEEGVHGSKAYLNALEKEGKTLPELMINFDSLIAGDVANVYVGKPEDPNLMLILDLTQKNKIPLETQGEPKSGLPYGMSIDASDHAPFKNKGVPILYFEATNWAAGKSDGYTQTTDAAVPNGEIWHTDQDQLALIENYFGDRPIRHLSLFIQSTLLFLENYQERANDH